MKIRLDILRRFVPLPEDPAAVRTLLDEVGVEVKRFDPTAPGVTMTLELLANRGDHHAYLGVAREVRGRTGAPLCVPEIDELAVGDAPHPMRVESDRCSVYTLTRLEGPAGASLDADALAVLEAAGLASKGAVIDATNVANLELGQPTHAFDADTIRGPVCVRASRPGERAWPLFQPEPVALPEGTLVIADDEKVLAIAGVIGCEESKTTPSTTAIVLESAAFDPVSVRKAARALGLSTDSSARFERGSDFAAPRVGAGRVARLLRSAGWRVVGAMGEHQGWVDPLRVIPFSPDGARRFLDIDASDAELAERLERYGFRVAPDGRFDVRSGLPAHPERLAVWVPSWRLWDVEHDSDLYEELARSIGYDNTPIGLPPIDLGGVIGPDERVGQLVEDVLVGHGFFEVITDGFYSRALRERLGLQPGHPLYDHVETANALDRAYSLLKNNGLAQAMECVATNVAVRNPDVKAYEFTRTFHPDRDAKNGVCTERRVLWAVASGAERPRSWAGPSRPADAAFARGVVEQIAGALGVAWTFGPLPAAHPLRDLLHPGRQLGVWASGRVIGALGEVHPAVVAAFGLKRTRPVYLELDHAALLAEGARAPYEEPSRLQPIERSLAFTFAPAVGPSYHRVTLADVVRALFDAGPTWLLDVDVVDRFEHPAPAGPSGAPTLTWTFALRFENEAGGRSADAVNAAVEVMIARVAEAWGEAGVSLRA